MTFDYKKFAKWIINAQWNHAATNHSWMSLRKLAKITKVSPSTLCRMLNGRKTDIDSILKICSWLGQDIGTFIKK